MRIKITALALSALLPLSVWAMPGETQGQGQQAQGQKSQQQEKNAGSPRDDATTSSRLV